MRVAYIINQYPKTSHSFIRREIAAVEDSGLDVRRYALRRVSESLPDASDQEEQQRTHVLLDGDRRELAASVGAALVSDPRRTFKALVHALRLGFRSERGMMRNLAYLAESALLLQWVRRDECSCIHAHFGTNSATVAMLCHELGGPPYSFTIHGPEEFDEVRSLALDEKVAGAQFVAVVSEFGRSQLLRHCLPSEWRKVHVVRCGVDESLLRIEPSAIPAAPRLVCVGRLCAQKGQLLLVEAAARLRAEGIALELVLVGDGEMRADMESAIARHGLQDSVRITGWASGEQVRAEISAARALVLPSFAEGLPVVIMEALALGRPVISTYVAGIPELVEPGRSGWLVPAGSISGLVAAMRAALQESPERLLTMGLEGRRRVRELHDVRCSAGKLSELFRQHTRGRERLTRGVERRLRKALAALSPGQTHGQEREAYASRRA